MTALKRLNDEARQDELKAILKDEYQDYDLVVALQNGRPCKNRVLQKEFTRLKEKAGLPNKKLKERLLMGFLSKTNKFLSKHAFRVRF